MLGNLEMSEVKLSKELVNLTIYLQSVGSHAGNPFHRSSSQDGNTMGHSFKLENVLTSTTMYEVKELIQKAKGLRPD